MPIRTGNSTARCAATAASTADLGEANAATTPSPVCLNKKPPCASIAARNTSSCAASATRMPSASFSHRRVEPSTSVNRNVTTPEGAAARSADTPAESHTDTRLPRTSADPARSPDTRVLRRTSASHRCGSLVRRVLRCDLLRTGSPIGKWKWSSPLLTSGCSDDEILPCAVRRTDMSDTVDDAAWPPQLKNAPRGGQRRRVPLARQKSASGVAAAPIPTRVKAGDIHV